jgi:DNA-binding protein
MTEISEKPSKHKESEEKPAKPFGGYEKERQFDRPRSPIPADTILIGKKPVMAYVTALMMHFTGRTNTLTIKARGRSISTAVDVVEVARRRFFSGKLNVKNIVIGTEAIGEGDDIRNVSTIEIKVEKTE